MVSTTFTRNVWFAALPALSLAVQCTVVAPTGSTSPEVASHDTGAGPLTRSVAVTANETVAPPGRVASAVTAAGTVITGAVVSTTVAVNDDAGDTLPWWSLAVQLTVVLPRANVEPDGGVHTTVGLASTASVPEAANETRAPDGPVASVVTLAGTTSAGAVRSATVTVKPDVAVLPWASVAVQVTVVAPRGINEPDTGVHFTATGPSTRSEAVGPV